jgi:hypothetical protein
MSKKKKSTNIFKGVEVESAEPGDESTEPVPGGDEAIHFDEDSSASKSASDSENAQVSSGESAEDAAAGGDRETSGEDVLDEVRRSLIESELEGEKKPGWWQRIRKGKKEEADKPEVREKIDLPMETMQGSAPDLQAASGETEEYLEQIDELIDMLEPEAAELAELEFEAQEQVRAEPEIPVDIAELKKQAFRPRAEGEEPESFSEVRAITLEGGEEVFVEVEAPPQDQFRERVSALENAFKPYRRYVYFLIAFLGIVVVILTSAILYDIYRQTLPPTPVAEPSNLPFPTLVGLPGGLNFDLSRGVLQDGKWDPRGPEWLEGTEICRWVALPWSRQLEAVIRTLTQDDSIKIVMSNGDEIEYRVYSIRELTFEEIQKLDSGSPCLLLILAKQDSETRWVVTAIP